MYEISIKTFKISTKTLDFEQNIEEFDQNIRVFGQKVIVFDWNVRDILTKILEMSNEMYWNLTSIKMLAFSIEMLKIST